MDSIGGRRVVQPVTMTVPAQSAVMIFWEHVASSTIGCAAVRST